MYTYAHMSAYWGLRETSLFVPLHEKAHNLHIFITDARAALTYRYICVCYIYIYIYIYTYGRSSPRIGVQKKNNMIT